MAQPSKQGFLYVFDRQTGQPVWPIEERPVPAVDGAGREVRADAAVSHQAAAVRAAGLQADDLLDFTPELQGRGPEDRLALSSSGPLFTPPMSRGEDGKDGMLYIPNGANWPGGSYDPETGILYVFSNTLTRVLCSPTTRSGRTWISSMTGGGGDTGGGLTVQGLPLVKPPWGRITAIDLNKGDIVWQVAHGDTPDS